LLKERCVLILLYNTTTVRPRARLAGRPWVNPKLHAARKSLVEAVKTEADRYAANVLPIIREAQKAGARTLREIAEALNARGIATARRGQWYAQSVAML
jgi:predicted TIM-barrel fold metal-dependent hydrolase